jgi:hypothetical protein
MEQLPADEAGRVRAVSITRALGVADGAGFDALMDALAADGPRSGGRRTAEAVPLF